MPSLETAELEQKVRDVALDSKPRSGSLLNSGGRFWVYGVSYAEQKEFEEPVKICWSPIEYGITGNSSERQAVHGTQN